MTLNLFADPEQDRTWRQELCPGAVVLRKKLARGGYGSAADVAPGPG